MRYAISYLSTANPDLSREEITNLFEETIIFNTNKDINGFLIYSDGNFFQFIEGEEEVIIELYSKIKQDHRHKNLIKFIGEDIFKPSHVGYICEIKTEYSEYDESKIKKYLNCLKVLNQSSRNAAEGVIENILRQ